MNTPLVIAVVIGSAETIAQARQQSSDFLVSEGLSLASNPPSAMLPTALSGDGNTTSHYACTTVWNSEQFERCKAYIAINKVPVEAFILAHEGGDKARQQQLENDFLVTRGLTRVV